jgi:hypothetical protein
MSSNLAETIYATMIGKIYTDLSKATEDDLRKLAESAILAETVFRRTAEKTPLWQQQGQGSR